MTEQEEFEFRARFEAEQAKQPATLRQKVMSSTPMRIVQGARDPIDAAAQLLPRGLEFATSLGGFAKNPVSDFFGSEAKRVDEGIANAENEYQTARKATGQEGADLARFAGNVASPANLAIAARAPAMANTGARIVGGAVTGAAGGAMQPVIMEDGKNFAATKAGQVAIGGVTGGIATPILGKVGDFVGQKIAAAINRPTKVDLMEASQEFAVNSGMVWDDLAKSQQDEIYAAAKTAAKNYAGADPKIAAKVADFESLKMPYLQGQVTRDPMQFAAEKNLQQVAGVGDPIRERVLSQNATLRGAINQFARDAGEEQADGSALVSALRKIDIKKGEAVDDAYKLARTQAGKDADVPLQGLAQDFSEVLNNFGDKVPSGVKNNFAMYGIGPIDPGMTQRKVFTVEAAHKLLKVISANQSNDPATNAALSALRGAVKKSVTQDAGLDDVFAPASKMASERFALHDAIPALDASASGAANPDTFVQNYILSKSASTPNVRAMAELLRTEDPQAFNQARAQIGAYIQRKALGENMAGDKQVAPERLAKALRDLGTEKIGGFFNPQELKQMQTIARVAAYMESPPAASRPNTSGNFGAITNIAQRLPGMPITSAIVGSIKNSLGNQLSVQKALSQKIPVKMTEDQARYLSQLLSAGGMAAGASTAQSLN